MKIEKAIELNKESETSLRTSKLIDYADAVRLGSEALKAWKEMRRTWRRPSSVLLLGETDE